MTKTIAFCKFTQEGIYVKKQVKCIALVFHVEKRWGVRGGWRIGWNKLCNSVSPGSLPPIWPAKNLQGWICLKAHVCSNLYGLPWLSMLFWPSGAWFCVPWLPTIYVISTITGTPIICISRHSFWGNYLSSKGRRAEKSCFGRGLISSGKMSWSLTSFLVYWDILFKSWVVKAAGATRNARQRLGEPGMVWYDLVWLEVVCMYGMNAVWW